MARGKVFDIQRHLFRGEAHRDVALAGNLQRGRCTDAVGARSCRHGGRGGGAVLDRQTHPQAVSDLGAFLRVAVIVVADTIAHEVEFLVEDTQGFPGDHVRCEIDVSHLSYLLCFSTLALRQRMNSSVLIFDGSLPASFRPRTLVTGFGGTLGAADGFFINCASSEATFLIA